VTVKDAFIDNKNMMVIK